MSQALFVVGPRQLELQSYEEAPLKPGEVRAEAVLSGISHGTELNLYRGTSPFHDRRFDPELRLFVPADDTQPYPKTLGYEWVGRVSEVGSGVTRFQVGDLVHLPRSHRQSHIFSTEERSILGLIEPLPSELDPEWAVFMALAGVALQAIHDAHLKLGDRVVIFGLGTIGLLAFQLARLDGAAWVDAVDPIPLRRELAERFGADRTLDPTAVDVGWEIKTASPHHGADVAIEVSGHYPALHQAIRSVRMGGTVVAAGYYQGGGTALRLGEEWHHNRVTMVSSMGVWDCPHRDHPAWDRARVHAAATDLLASGRLRTDGLITHRFPFERAAEAYELIDYHPQETAKVVLTY
jgi:2-desacetyl-2-hydroxyethyl bacteriochlorophyllide A dehydrogenase